MAIAEVDLYSAERRERAKVLVNSVSVRYGSGQAAVVALSDVSLAIGENDFFCVVGPSGCGKTSLLNLIAGFERPTAGDVVADRRVVTGPGQDRGVVFQQGALFMWMTVRENVAFGPRSQGLPTHEAYETADHFVELVGLSDFRDRFPYELSGGMRQRVGIARALAANPGILLMDEPFGALDQQTREVLQEEVKKIWRGARKTIVWITHSLEEALFLGTHVVVITARPGKVKASFQVSYGIDDQQLMESEELADDRRTLFRLLRSETVAAMAAETTT